MLRKIPKNICNYIPSLVIWIADWCEDSLQETAALYLQQVDAAEKTWQDFNLTLTLDDFRKLCTHMNPRSSECG